MKPVLVMLFNNAKSLSNILMLFLPWDTEAYTLMLLAISLQQMLCTEMGSWRVPLHKEKTRQSFLYVSHMDTMTN